MKIEVVPYRSEWTERFDQERKALLLGVGEVIVNLHHIGSTAVVGLAAKPIIDMMLEVCDLAALDACEAKFEALGYEAMGEFGIVGRRYYRKGGDDRTHQIHAFETSDSNLLRHLAFRDYLSAHPEVRKEYQELKIQVAAQCDHDIDRYCDGKDAFIQWHEAKALDWMRVSR